MQTIGLLLIESELRKQTQLPWLNYLITICLLHVKKQRLCRKYYMLQTTNLKHTRCDIEQYMYGYSTCQILIIYTYERSIQLSFILIYIYLKSHFNVISLWPTMFTLT